MKSVEFIDISGRGLNKREQEKTIITEEMENYDLEQETETHTVDTEIHVDKRIKGSNRLVCFLSFFYQ